MAARDTVLLSIMLFRGFSTFSSYDFNDECASWQTENIPSKDEIDPDVLHSMSSLGCFKNRERLVRNLLKHE